MRALKRRQGERLYWVGMALYISSLFLHASPDSVMGDDRVTWLSGIATQLVYARDVIDTPASIQGVSHVSVGDRGDGVEAFRRREIFAALRKSTVLLSALVMVIRMCAWQRVRYTPMRLLPARMMFAALMILAAVSLATCLWESARTYANGAIHLGVGGAFWTVSLLLVGFSLLYTSISTAPDKGDPEVQRKC